MIMYKSRQWHQTTLLESKCAEENFTSFYSLSGGIFPKLSTILPVPYLLHQRIILDDDCVLDVGTSGCRLTIILSTGGGSHAAAVEVDVELGLQSPGTRLDVDAVRITVKIIYLVRDSSGIDISNYFMPCMLPTLNRINSNYIFSVSEKQFWYKKCLNLCC